MTPIELVLQFVLPFVLERLRDAAPPIVAAAIVVVTPIIIEMVRQAEDEGIGFLSFRFRAPYEARLLDALRLVRGLGDLAEEGGDAA